MWVGLVVGTVVATRKDERLVGHKLLIVRRYDLTGSGGDGQPTVVVDKVGAGVGERVLVVTGSSARAASNQPDAPIDGAVVGIIDRLDVERDLLARDSQEG